MKKLINAQEITANVANEVKVQVENLMKRSGYSFLFNNEEEIEKFYREEWELSSPIQSEFIQSFVIDGQDGELEVKITAYYPDGGMDWEDYSYIIEVVEY